MATKQLSEAGKKAIVKLKQLRDQKSLLESDIKEVQSEGIAEMKKAGIASTKVETDEGVYNGTLVEGSSLKFDEERLKKALGAKRWAKVTSRVLDVEKLENLIAEDEAVANIAAKCSHEEPRAPYIRAGFKAKK